jgi:hypothetical protein
METMTIKEKAVSKNGLTVIKKGNVIETYNKMQKLIHTIDLSQVGYKILIHAWIGYRTSDEFIEICEGHLYDQFKKNNCAKIQVDISKMSGSFSGVNDWMANTFMPKLVNAGFKCSSVVLPADLFAKLSAEEWESKVSGFVTRNFDNADAALTWLKTQ